VVSIHIHTNKLENKIYHTDATVPKLKRVAKSWQIIPRILNFVDWYYHRNPRKLVHREKWWIHSIYLSCICSIWAGKLHWLDNSWNIAESGVKRNKWNQSDIIIQVITKWLLILSIFSWLQFLVWLRCWLGEDNSWSPWLPNTRDVLWRHGRSKMCFNYIDSQPCIKRSPFNLRQRKYDILRQVASLYRFFCWLEYIEY
jgi:hypothetical protein